MRKNRIYLAFSLLSILFLACKSTNKNFDYTVPSQNNIDEERLDTATHNILQLFADSILAELEMTKFVYSKNSYKSEWTYPSSNHLKTDTLLQYLSKSTEHGIAPETFDTDTIKLMYQKLKNNELSYAAIALLEVKISTSFLLYCKALHFGLYKPKAISPNYYFDTQDIDTTFTNKCHLRKRINLNQFLTNIQPNKPSYIKLQNERQKYLQLSNSHFDTIPYLANKETIKFGTKHQIIPLIHKRLAIQSELSRNQNNNLPNDAFDQELLKALNRFRTKTSLFIDNEIGNNSIKALNKPFSYYVNKIDINLERLRWKPTKTLGNKYIHVNVADMSLRAIKNDSIKLHFNVCVGKYPTNKTPFLRTNIYEIILNPTWKIPSSIIIKEIARIAAKDSLYLDRHKMKVYKNGVIQKASKINWTKVSKNYQPYTLIQDSGSQNALGRIKFNFANRHNVYLHDTNSKSAFNRHYRAVSHGCVRVEKPLELAFFCLPEIKPSDTKEQLERIQLHNNIRYSIYHKTLNNQANDIANKKLPKIGLYPNIPIIIDYYTCFTNANGKVIFRDDIYELDKYIYNNLQQFTHINIAQLAE